MAANAGSRIQTLKTRASRTFYFLMGVAVGIAGVWAAVNLSDSAAGAVNLVPESDLVEAHLTIDDLEDRREKAATAVGRAVEIQLAQEGLDSLFDALELLAPSVRD